MRTQILIVDDLSSNLENLNYLISSHFSNVNVVQAFSGKEALRLLNDFQFQLLITDLNMPGGDGYFLINELRGMNGNLPIIIWSGEIHFDSSKIVDKTDIFYVSKMQHSAELVTLIRKVTQAL